MEEALSEASIERFVQYILKGYDDKTSYRSNPLHVIFKDDYLARQSTKFIYWELLDHDYTIFDASHIKPGLLFVVNTSRKDSVKYNCVYFNQLSKNDLYKRVRYVFDYGSRGCLVRTDENRIIRECMDKKNRLHRRDGKPALEITDLEHNLIRRETYKHGQLHSYGPNAPSSVEHIDEYTGSRTFHYKGAPQYKYIQRNFNKDDPRECEFTLIFYEKGKQVCESKSILKKDDSLSGTIIKGKRKIEFADDDLVTSIKEVAPEEAHFRRFPFLRIYEMFDYKAFTGIPYGLLSERFPGERYYFVPFDQEVDVEVLDENKVPTGTFVKTTLGENIRTTQQLYFNGEKIWQPAIPVFRHLNIYVTTEILTYVYEAIYPRYTQGYTADILNMMNPTHQRKPETQIMQRGICGKLSGRKLGPLITREPEGEKDTIMFLEELKDIPEPPPMKTNPIYKPQRGKLLIMIMFLTMVQKQQKEPFPYIVFYSTAFDCPYIYILRDMFPLATFIVFSSKKLSISPDRRIIIIKEDFKEDVFKLFRTGFSVFISDVMDSSEKQKMEGINDLQFSFRHLAHNSLVITDLPKDSKRSFFSYTDAVLIPWLDKIAIMNRWDEKNKDPGIDHREFSSLMGKFLRRRQLSHTASDPIFGVNHDLLVESNIIDYYLLWCNEEKVNSTSSYEVARWMEEFDLFFKRKGISESVLDLIT